MKKKHTTTAVRDNKCVMWCKDLHWSIDLPSKLIV